MIKAICRATMATLIVAAMGGGACAAPQFGFGGGGPSVGLFMPDLSAINSFLDATGYPTFSGNLVLVGGGGRGGVVPGLTYGGAGWGAWIEAERDGVHAEYNVGLGGFDLGLVVGGDDRSVLTVGGLLGGGGAELVLTEPADGGGASQSPRAIVVEPDEVVYESGFLFVGPYVDMRIQLLDWVGFGLRTGYALTLFAFDGGNPGLQQPPEMAPSGAFVRFSVVFGGIGPIVPGPADTDLDATGPDNGNGP